MSVATETPEIPARTPPSSGALRNGRWSGYLHILAARMKELRREPEVVFWVFGFPLLLALGLGIAFRNKPADVTSIAVVQGPSAQNAMSLIERSPQRSSIHAEVADKPQALKGFRLGKYDLVVDSDGKGGFQYLYDS